MQRMDLAGLLDRQIETLSKGMSQKVQFVAAVVSNPELLILDEPFSGLDPVNAQVLKDAVLEMRRRGATVVFSTHDMATAERMCDRIFMIFRGRKVLDGSLESIQDQYGADTVRIRTSAGAAALADLPGVESVNDFGQLQEVRLNGDPQVFLTRLAARTAVYHFEVTRPSLQDIFMRIAGKDTEYRTQNTE
jgi:ABC-2 type transport system ATP-binding protein